MFCMPFDDDGCALDHYSPPAPYGQQERSVGGHLGEHGATTMQAATRPQRSNQHFSRAPAREAIQPKHASGRAALSSAVFRGWLVQKMDGSPPRAAHTGREIRGCSVIQHALDGGRIFVWLSSNNTRHQCLPLPTDVPDSTVALTAASARSADAVAAV